MIVDITPIFYDLLVDIAALDYTDLINTSLMIQFMDHVNKRDEFVVHYKDTLYFKTVDELFLGSMDYFRRRGMQSEFDLIEFCINKMRQYISFDENLDEINDFISRIKF